MASLKELLESPRTVVGSLDEPQAIVEGLYVIINKATRLVITLKGGSSSSGTRCNAQRYQDGECWTHTVWLVRQDGANGTYSLTNVQADTVLDLDGGNRNTHVQGCAREPDNANQRWVIQQEAAGLHTIQSSRTNEYLGMRSMQEGTEVKCSAFGTGDEQRLWELERLSRTAKEIMDIMVKWDESLSRRLSFPYTDGGQYFVLPSPLRKSVWEKTGILRQRLRKNVFDYDDFVIKVKQASNEWARDNFKIDGYSALCGIIFGRGALGPIAYNWYLSSDMQTLILFDAQTGREFTTPAVEQAGFTPSFGIF